MIIFGLYIEENDNVATVFFLVEIWIIDET